MALEQELQYFHAHKDEWLRIYADQFALIKGEELYGTFTTLQEAFDEGIRRLGNQPFLIRQISEREELVQYPALSVGMLSAHS